MTWLYLILSNCLGSFNMVIVISTVPSIDFDKTDVSSTCTTQLVPGGKGAPVLIRAHSFSYISSWQLGYKYVIKTFYLKLWNHNFQLLIGIQFIGTYINHNY